MRVRPVRAARVGLSSSAAAFLGSFTRRTVVCWTEGLGEVLSLVAKPRVPGFGGDG